MTHKFYIHAGEGSKHAEKLKSGLAKMASGFMARLCGCCGGQGRYRQMYTAGCGGGYYYSVGECEYCDGCGLTQSGKPAPVSVLNQVLGASNDPQTN